MNMFEMMKQAKDMYAKTRDLQKKLEQRRIEVEYNGVHIVANGKQEIVSIQLSDALLTSGKEKVEKALLKACNEVSEKIRKVMEEEAKGVLGGMPPQDMMNMLK